MNGKQLGVVIAAAGLLIVEALYVPIRVFHNAGRGLTIRVEGLLYEWLPFIPANSEIQGGIIAYEVMGTILIAAIAFWLCMDERWTFEFHRRWTSRSERVPDSFITDESGLPISRL